MTPLHTAAIAGHHEVCERLIEAGALTQARDVRGRTPAAWAARRGNSEVAKLLEGSARMSKGGFLKSGLLKITSQSGSKGEFRKVDVSSPVDIRVQHVPSTPASV